MSFMSGDKCSSVGSAANGDGPGFFNSSGVFCHRCRTSLRIMSDLRLKFTERILKSK